MWNLLEGKDLFSQVHDDQGRYSSWIHLAEMVAVLGPPPRRVLDLSAERLNYRWQQPVENPEGELCYRPREYFGGPFFNRKGMTYIGSHIFNSEESQLTSQVLF